MNEFLNFQKRVPAPNGRGHLMGSGQGKCCVRGGAGGWVHGPAGRGRSVRSAGPSAGPRPRGAGPARAPRGVRVRPVGRLCAWGKPPPPVCLPNRHAAGVRREIRVSFGIGPVRRAARSHAPTHIQNSVGTCRIRGTAR